MGYNQISRSRETTRGALRTTLLATVFGIAMPMLAAPAAAAPLAGQFGGSAQTIGASGVSQDISLALHNSASAACPCQGTHGRMVQKSTSSINVAGILSVQATVATAYGAKTRKTAETSQSATLTGVTLLGGMITADALVAEASVNATPTQFTKSDAGTSFTNLVINGTMISPSVPDNTVVTLPGLGSATIYAVSAGKNAGEARESVDILDIDITKSNSLGLPVGAKLVIGRAKAVYEREQPQAILGGGASGLQVNADAGSPLQEAAGSAASIGIPGCSGTGGKTLTNSAANLSVPGLLSIGAISNTAVGTEGKTSVAATSSTVSNVSLLGGVITVSSITAAAQESRTGSSDTPSTAGSEFAGLAIGGVPVNPDLPPNTTLALPGIGSVVVNEQVLGAKSVTVNGLHVTVTQQNLLGLAPGAEIILAHAAASARAF